MSEEKGLAKGLFFGFLAGGVVGGIVVWNVEWVDVSTFEDLAVGKTVYIATRIYTNTERE